MRRRLRLFRLLWKLASTKPGKPVPYRVVKVSITADVDSYLAGLNKLRG